MTTDRKRFPDRSRIPQLLDKSCPQYCCPDSIQRTLVCHGLRAVQFPSRFDPALSKTFRSVMDQIEARSRSCPD